MLFLLGGGLGIGITILATKILTNVRPPLPIPMFLEFSPDARVLVFTVVVALLAGLVFGLAPALQTTSTNLVSSLKDDSGRSARTPLAFVYLLSAFEYRIILCFCAFRGVVE